MLFLLYINDITECVHSTTRLFADDNIAYQKIVTPDGHAILNNDMDTLIQWAKMWQMDFNVTILAIDHVDNLKYVCYV